MPIAVLTRGGLLYIPIGSIDISAYILLLLMHVTFRREAVITSSFRCTCQLMFILALIGKLEIVCLMQSCLSCTNVIDHHLFNFHYSNLAL